MNRLALILLGLGALAAPLPALAVPAQTGTWLKGCQTGQTSKSLKGGQWACYTPAAGADDESASPILDTTQCENVDIWMADDYAAAAAACTVTWDIEQCPPGGSGLATDAAKNDACEDAPGVTDLSGNDVESDLAMKFLRVVGNNAGANIENCQIVVYCAEESAE